MPTQPTYPGVYIEEVPSGVRTISGVATSITMFIGRTSKGPLNEPTLCLNYTEFESAFGSDTTYSDLPRAIRLFFQNGGTKCYVTRIANGAIASSVTLTNETGDNVLTVTAKNEGTLGDSIRLAITYKGQHPESNFNIEVFRWDTSSSGQTMKSDTETWQNLSMDPQSSRYAPNYVSQNSSLIELTDINAEVAVTDQSLSRAGRYTPDDSDIVDFTETWQRIIEYGIQFIRDVEGAIVTDPLTSAGTYTGIASTLYELTVNDTGTIGTDEITIDWLCGSLGDTITIPASYASGSIDVNDGLGLEFTVGQTLSSGDTYTVFVHPPAYRLRMSNDAGKNWSNISFYNRIDFTGIAASSDFVNDFNDVFNETFTTTPIVASFQPGFGTQEYLQFACTDGDVRVESYSTNDLARILMLGSANGGLESSRYSSRRPAPTGISFNVSNWDSFAEQTQNYFDTIDINGEEIDLDDSLITVASDGSSLMHLDADFDAFSGGFDGIREKLSAIASIIESYRTSNPDFNWSAEVLGNRLYITATDGGDNTQATLQTSANDIASYFNNSVRYYSLGTSGSIGFQVSGVAGDDGNAPTLNDFQDAYEVIDREVDLFNLMVLPADAEHDENTINSIWGPASIFCQQRRAFLIMDAPASWTTVQEATDPTTGVNSLRIGLVKDHCAIYYPRVIMREDGLNINVSPGGAIAGLMSRIDGSRGVWKAPAGTEADIRDVVGLEYRFSDGENGVLNPEGINTLRIFPNGIVSWGARTMDGDDDFASEWKYVPIRRLALFIEESLYRGLKWVVFEPNDEPLWSQIRMNVGAFMHNLFRQGAFQGVKKSDAYFVKCDSETTTQNDRNLGMVNIWVGFAPLKPAEFVIIKLQQIAGEIEV